MEDSIVTRKDIVPTLRSVIDPEVGMNILDLGLIYDLQLTGSAATIRLTMTTPTCPVEAIYPEDEVPAGQEHYIQWNEYLANEWREMGYNITEKKDPLPDAEQWDGREKSEEDILTWSLEE